MRASRPTPDGTTCGAPGGLPPESATQSIRWRALVLIVALVPAVVFFNVWGCLVAGYSGAPDSLLGLAVGGLAVLRVANAVLGRWRPRWTFSRAELIAVYVALVMAVGMTVTVWDWGGSVASMVTWPIWNAGPDNQWEQTIWPNIASWLVVTDRGALAGFFLGDSNPYESQVLAAWIRPALCWTAWAVATLWVTLCLNVIVRRRWSREEQLSFPMTILPLQMTEPRGAVFASPLWWGGIAVAAVFSLWGTIARFAPGLPVVPTSFDLGRYLTNNPPWDAIRTPYLGWDFWYIGLSYLMPLDLAFSLIVFNIGWRAEYVLSRLLGWTISPWAGFPYGDQQSIGAYLAVLASVLWLDRSYLFHVLRKVMGLPSLANDAEEAFSYRTAVVGAIAGLAFLWYFLDRAGMTVGVTAFFLFLYFAMLMVMARVRAQLGPPNHEMYGDMPEFVLTEFPGTRAIGARGLGVLGLLGPYMGGQRATPTPAQLEGLRMAERARVNPRQLARIMMAVVVGTMICYFWASVHIGYRLGIGSARVAEEATFIARTGSVKLDTWLRTPTNPNWSGVGAIGLGFAGTLVLMALKVQFPAWPLHPVAFPLALCYPLDTMMPAIIAAFLAKFLLMRYGGLRAHRRALPFFLGLIVGSAVVQIPQLILYRIAGISG